MKNKIYPTQNDFVRMINRMKMVNMNSQHIHSIYCEIIKMSGNFTALHFTYFKENLEMKWEDWAVH